MARTLINKLIFDGLKSSKKATLTALDATNNMYVDFTRDNLNLIAANTSDTDSITITIKAAGNFDDFIVTIPKSETHVIANLESAYFKQPDGNLYINPSAATGTIFAVEDVI